MDGEVPLRQRGKEQESSAGSGTLSEMTLEEIRLIQENVWRQARGSAIPPDPSTALLGTEEALAIDEASSKLQREADAREKDFKSGKAKREPFKAWRERLAKEEDERDRKAKEEKVGDLERQWSREEIVAIWARFDVKMEDVDYMIKTGGDDVDQAWHDLQIIAKATMRLDPADPMDHDRAPDDIAAYERFPEVNIIQATEGRTPRITSDGRTFHGPKDMDIDGPGVKLEDAVKSTHASRGEV